MPSPDIIYSPTRETQQKSIDFVSNALQEHSLLHVPRPGFQSYETLVHNVQEETVGICIALVNWNWLYISLLWLHADYRKYGIGSELLKKVEDFGIAMGCSNAHLDTFSFQAPGFYLKKSYEIFAQLDNYPPGHTRYFLRKVLQ
ncbi:MAG: GNAT family N-acetyltransferase [Spirochaetota bacterium]